MWTRFVPAPFLLVAVLAGGCSRDGDVVPDPGAPSALGGTTPLRVLQNPEDPNRLKIEPAPTCAQSFSTPLTLDGVTVNWVDRYDETGAGDVGTVWIQDYKSNAPWSGSSIFSPSFVPASLYVAAGDVIDLRGLYQVNVCIGGNVDFLRQIGPGVVLAQVATPTSTFRFEGPPSEPVDVPYTDFETFESGRKWIGMVVRLTNVTAIAPEARGGRLTVGFIEANNITLSNEFQSIDSVQAGARFASVTGVVTWFFNPFKLATRTPEDLVAAP